MHRPLPVIILLVLMVTGCTQPAPPPAANPSSGPPVSSAPALAPDEMQACVARNTHPFVVAGIEIGKPGADVLERLGKPLSVETSPRYGDSQYHFPFGILHVQGNGTIYSLTLTADAPTGDLFPGIRTGARRESVLTYLSGEGYCGIPQPNGTDVTFLHATGSPLLTLSFSEDGALRQVKLSMTGE